MTSRQARKAGLGDHRELNWQRVEKHVLEEIKNRLSKANRVLDRAIQAPVWRRHRYRLVAVRHVAKARQNLDVVDEVGPILQAIAEAENRILELT